MSKLGSLSLFNLLIIFSAKVSSQSVKQEFLLAKADWIAANNNTAEASFLRIVKKSRDIEILAQSNYYLAVINQARNSYQNAILFYKRVLEFELPSKILKHANLNGNHLKHLACSSLVDIYLETEKFSEALHFLKYGITHYNLKDSEMSWGSFESPTWLACFEAKRWATAYAGLRNYDSAVLVLLPHAFGEDKANRLVFDKFCELVPKAFSSEMAKTEVKNMLMANPTINQDGKIIEIMIFNEIIKIPNDDSLRLYLINNETLKDFLLNSNPIKFLLSNEW